MRNHIEIMRMALGKTTALKLCFSIAAVLMSVSVFSQPKNTKVEFEQLEWNFGTIKEAEGKVSHAFKYKNCGDNPLLFYSVQVSCGCTTPTYRKEPLPAGWSSQITITFDPANRPGIFEKTILIQGNMEGGGQIIRIKGNVEPRPKGVEDDYPIVLSQGIRIAESQAKFGAVSNNREHMFDIRFYNNSDKDARVEFDNRNLPSWLKIENGETIKPKSELRLRASIVPTDKKWGRISHMLPVRINGSVQPIEIYVSADLVEDFSNMTINEKNNAPYILLSSYFYSFSDSKQGERLRKNFNIINRGKGTLIIRHIDCDSSRVKVKLSKDVLSVGDTSVMSVTLDSRLTGEVAEAVRIISNDPIYPVRELRVIANIE